MASHRVPVVVLTMAADSADEVVADVSAALAAGTPPAPLEWVRWPLLETRLIDIGEGRSMLARLESYRWVVMPSPSTVVALARQLQTVDITWPRGARAAVVGPGSLATFHRFFGDASVTSPAIPPHDADRLIEAMAAEEPAIQSAQVLVVNRLDAKPAWLPRLRARVRSVDVLPVFATASIEPPARAREQLAGWLSAGRPVHWVCGSAGQIASLARWLDAGGQPDARRYRLWAPHPRLAAAAGDVGFANASSFGSRIDLARGLQSIDESPIQEPAPLANESPSASRSSSSATGSNAPVTPVEPVAEDGKQAGMRATDRVGEAEIASDARSIGDPADAPAADPAFHASASPPVPPTADSDPERPRPPARPTDPPRRRSWWPLLLLLVIAGLSVAGWWLVQQRFIQEAQNSARRFQDAEGRASRLEQQLKALQDAQSQLASRSGQLEDRIAKSAGQQEQLQALYDELAKSRGDTALAEVEQAVLAASQHLQLNSNVAAALMSLQIAERRIGAEDGGERIGLRRLIGQDIERIKALPAVDLGGVAGRLDEVIARIDRLPLLSDANPLPPAANAAAATGGQPAPAAGAGATAAAGSSGSAGGSSDAAATPATTASPPAAPAASPATDSPAPSAAPAGAPVSTLDAIRATLLRWWAQLRGIATETAGTVREEFRGMVTIRRIDRPDGLLLSPEQRTVLRENLRVLLLNARLNLLNREEKMFQQDLGKGIQALERWFDTSARDVEATVATLKSLQKEPLVLKVPDLSETLAAVRAARASSESRR